MDGDIKIRLWIFMRSLRMIDTTLIDRLTVLANKEKKIKEYKRRLRVKGKITSKGTTKKGNLILKVKSSHSVRDVPNGTKEENEYKFTVLKSHKERFTLAEKLKVNNSVSIEGIPKFRMIICTRLKALEKGIQEGKQTKLI